MSTVSIPNLPRSLTTASETQNLSASPTVGEEPAPPIPPHSTQIPRMLHPGEGPEPLGPQLSHLPSSLLVVASNWTPLALLTSGLTPSRDGELPGDLWRDPGDEPPEGP